MEKIRWLVPISATAILLLSSAASYAQLPSLKDFHPPDRWLKPGTMVDVGGYRLNLYCSGAGTPTVVMESGGGWGAIGWAGIQDSLAARAKTRVCSYDRAGMNFSDVGPVERPAIQTIHDLHELLKRAKIPGPYVLIGWSAGGMMIRWFASLYPSETGALVIVDGSDSDYTDPKSNLEWITRRSVRLQACVDAVKTRTLTSDQALFQRCRASLFPFQYSEALNKANLAKMTSVESYEQSLYEVQHAQEGADALKADRKPLGSIPVRLLMASEHVSEASFVEFATNCEKIAASSDNGLLIIVPKSAHMIQYYRPEVVIDTIADMVAAARARKH